MRRRIESTGQKRLVSPEGLDRAGAHEGLVFSKTETDKICSQGGPGESTAGWPAVTEAGALRGYGNGVRGDDHG